MGAVGLVFRTAGGKETGLGHVRRCLSLAQALRRLGMESMFALDGGEQLVERVNAAGFEGRPIRPDRDLAQTTRLVEETGAAAIVADSYTLSPDYFRGLAQTGATVVALDDLGERELPADMVVNGSAGAERIPYQGAAHTRFLLGPNYILLRPQFAQAPNRDYASQVRRVLITVGGSDPRDLTPRLMRWTARTAPGVAIDVVVGPLFANGASIEAAASEMSGRARLHVDPPEIRALMLSADLALCAGGQTTYELAATATPAVAVRTAENQSANLAGLARAGALFWVGDAADADLEGRLRAAVRQLVGDRAARRALGQRGRALVDGLGSERVARAIAERTKAGAQ